jgi:hypothetical protein
MAGPGGIDRRVRDLADGAVERARVPEIDGIHQRHRAGRNVGRRHLHAQPHGAEDGQLRARVEALDVVCWIGFGEPQLLGALERLGKRRAAGHARQDEVARAVEDAGDADELVAADAIAERADHRNAAGHRRFEAQMTPPLGGELAERGPVMRDELLVRGDDRSARVEGASHPRAGRIASSHNLHDHVRVGRENVLDVARPDDVVWDPVDAPARGVADEDVGQADTGGRPLGQDAGHRPAHGAEPEQGHANGGCSHEGDAPKRLMVRERADPVKFMLLTFS